MWEVGRISSGLFVGCTADSETRLNFFRFPTGAVWLSIAIDDSAAEKIDPNRLPFVWIDDRLETDVGESAALDNLLPQEDPLMRMVTIDDKAVGVQVWHGNIKEGIGIIERLSKGSEMTVRLFLLPHKIIDTKVSLVGIDDALRRAFLV